jgi:hypothetical protein
VQSAVHERPEHATARPIGEWRVVRRSGLMPPVGLAKTIGAVTGETRLFGVPVGRFRVVGRMLIYRGWPVADMLDQDEDGSWEGRGLLFGREFCRFELHPDGREHGE